jgi:MoxR-like ATPase
MTDPSLAPVASHAAPEPLPLDAVAARADTLRTALAQVVVGQGDAVSELLVALLSGGHALLEGVPGLAKTLLARTLAAALGLPFRRVQFTPDLMPSDVIGTNIFDLATSSFRLQRGPVFTNVLLGDEINRSPPKTQAALLEAMEERQVTIDGHSYLLTEPFFVVATQNPLDHEGTWPLPEAQLDRFMVRVRMDYPAPADEKEVYRRSLGAAARPDDVKVVLAPGELAAIRLALRGVHVEERVLDYLLALIGATRRDPRLAAGASPRAGTALLAAARTWAALDGRAFVLPDDIKRMARPVLRHRLVPTPDAELEGATGEVVLSALLARIEVPR